MLINNAVITGSLTVNGTDVTYITGSSQISSSFLALSSSYLITSASYVVTSGSYVITSGSYAQSSASLSIRTGNLEATASTLTSASSSFAAQSASLSTRLTTDETNIATLTLASASFAIVSSSFSSTSGSLSTRVTNLEATSSTVSSSFASTSGSIAGRVTLIEGQYATTGSNNFTGPQFINQASNAISFTSTASLYTDGGLRVAKDSFVSGTAYFNNITVYGTSSIEYITSSQIDIGSNVITVNTDTPAIRFGGISVFDSGSTQLTGSLFWDSEKNHWIYSNPSGSAYNSAMLMNGPRNTGSLGTEQGTTNNALMKGQGGDHITSSQMIDDGTTVQIPGNLQVTGSIVGSSTVTATNGLLIGNGGATATTNYLPKFTGASTIGNSIVSESSGIVSVAGRFSASGNDFHSVIVDQGTAQLKLERITTSAGYMYIGADNVGFKILDSAFATRLTLTSGGNLGLGVTPSAWESTYKVFQIGTVGSVYQGDASNVSIGNNLYVNTSGSARYITNNYSTLQDQYNGQYRWFTAPSGTAGNAITFTQAMTLNASGDLGVGTTTLTNSGGYKTLSINGSTGGQIAFQTAGTGYAFIYSNTTDLRFYTNGGAFRFENTTGLEVGYSAAIGLYKLDVNGTGRFVNGVNMATTSGNVGIGVIPTQNIPLVFADIGGDKILFNNNPNHYKIGLGVAVAGGDYMMRLTAGSTGAGEFGFYTTTNLKMLITSGGNVLIGTTTDSGYKLDVNGTGRFSGAVTAATYLTLSEDGTYTGTYYTLGFSGTSNGANRIFGARDGSDGIYIASATGTPIHFRAGGGTTNNLIIASTGAATFSSTVTLPNNTYLQFKDSAGTARTVLAVDASNSTVLRPAASGGAIAIQNYANTTNLLTIAESTGYTTLASPQATIGNDGGAQKKLITIGLDGQDYQYRYILLCKVPTFGNTTVNCGFRGTIALERTNGIGIDVHDDFDLTVSYGNAIAFRQTSYQEYQTALVQLPYNGVQYLALFIYSAPGYSIAYIDAIQTNYGGWLDGNVFTALNYATSQHSSISYGTNNTTFKTTVVATGDVTAYSDAKLKENVVTIDNALEKVKALRGVFYNRIDIEDKSRKTGVIAQEIQEILPEVISTSNDTLGVAYGNMVGVLIEAIKEQQTQIEELKILIHGLTK